MRGVFEKIKNALHKEDLEFMQQADLMACIDSIIDKVASDDKNGWIPVEKELPDRRIDVEVTLANGVRHIGWYSGVREGWLDTLGIYEGFLDVIAWKEPSEPYQPHICTNGDCVFNGRKDCPAAQGCTGYKRKRTNFDRCCESMEAMAQIIDIAKIGWTKEQIMEWLQKEECEVPE